MSRLATEKKVSILTHRLVLVDGLLLSDLEAIGLLWEKVFLVRGHCVGVGYEDVRLKFCRCGV